MKDLIGSLSQQNTLPRSCAAGLESLSGRGGVGLTEQHTLNTGSHSLGRDAMMTPQNESPVTLRLTVTVDRYRFYLFSLVLFVCIIVVESVVLPPGLLAALCSLTIFWCVFVCVVDETSEGHT